MADLLERLQMEDIIKPIEGVASKWASPILVVPKANNDIRMCIDLRKVNQAIIRERYLIPTELNRAKVFSKLTLKQEFFNTN